MLAYGGNPRNPRHPVDFVDIVDIFHKSLKLLCFLLIHGVDILWIFSWTRIYPWIFSCARDRRSLSKTESARKSRAVIDDLPTLRGEKKTLTPRGYAC